MWLFSILVLIFAIMLVSGIHARGHEHDAFMSKAQTTSLRGLAILIVVIHHLGQRLDSALPLTPYLMNFFIGYLAVGLFFFLSGYGNMLSISHMQRSFAGKMAWIVKRIIGLLLIFYVAEAMALICELLSHQPIIPSLWGLITFSLPGWDTWYIKIQLLLYVLLFIAWLPDKLTANARLALLTVLVVIAIVVMKQCGLSEYWWNTLLCFPAGAFFAQYRQAAERLLQRYWAWAGCAFTVLFMPAFLLNYRGQVLAGIPAALLFCCAVVSLNFKLCISSKPLIWLGTISFEIFLTHTFLLKTLVLVNVWSLPRTHAMLPLLIGTLILSPINKAITDRIKALMPIFSSNAASRKKNHEE
ncbi:acyltransferase family protein [Bifidobacterium dentium]|uniref:Acyltransferase 3 n=1 Tax=Bifidobacterium dentium (strain ATCC 27534 / DSM 20436 / JCM 1195 / Bd1) TaxID=401473 RepID=D2Q650_BIFDB|nr:acyltransferase family protein [Bifidobacterium dentium]ADB10415.1 Acyltransferase 3 [Bifidobacterium dentium Bd1]EDT45486.1 acyltransferase [Bifidobacterium dentium ATCC 27678]SEC38264.1 Membrane-bound acyltransferase YfiQ, involved in biofilm formation [Bifidobacterium dentium JCM 1195 = DSM 20436]VEG24397.1 acyltransferase 3 [Bifidobacterium dentium]BAQ27726.1 hypothetical protein BBDE_1732 [Bifidobacterium dentium JCM 1195 = DSM 20436]